VAETEETEETYGKTMEKTMEKPMENHILSYFMGKNMEKLWVSCRFHLKSTQWY